ncbi:MAG TPA: GNAT family N-acetyltransferase [Devosiaceae bacterium]|nr:GNAT family N-acetyltransferase [Devosiaceae bacterium]
MSAGIEIRKDPHPAPTEFSELWQAAWGTPFEGDAPAVWRRSLAHFGAYADGRLAGYVNLAWDGGKHAFLLDTMVHPRLRRRGIATRLVLAAVDAARQQGVHWLHVDYEPQLQGFYEGCGFRPTLAGLIPLAGEAASRARASSQ